MNCNAFVRAAALALGLLAAPLAQSATEMLDQVVAIVDDDVIMASELRERLDIARETYGAERDAGQGRVSAGLAALLIVFGHVR